MASILVTEEGGLKAWAILLIGAVFLVGAGRAYATTVVAVIDTHAVIIGADSKSVTDSGEAGKICKIGFAKNFYWGAAGIAIDSVLRFSLFFELSYDMQGDGDIYERMTTFSDRTTPVLISIMNRLYHREPSRYFGQYEGKFPISVVFAGFENGKPMVHLVRFRAILNVKTETVAVRAERTDVSPTEEPRIVTIGIDRAIRRALADDPDLRKSVVNPGTVIDLINKEVVEAPAYVGPPIEVVRIDKNGPAWASKCFL